MANAEPARGSVIFGVGPGGEPVGWSRVTLIPRSALWHRRFETDLTRHCTTRFGLRSISIGDSLSWMLRVRESSRTTSLVVAPTFGRGQRRAF